MKRQSSSGICRKRKIIYFLNKLQNHSSSQSFGRKMKHSFRICHNQSNNDIKYLDTNTREMPIMVTNGWPTLFSNMSNNINTEKSKKLLEFHSPWALVSWIGCSHKFVIFCYILTSYWIIKRNKIKRKRNRNQMSSLVPIIRF